jgi:hypothetical protein
VILLFMVRARKVRRMRRCEGHPRNGTHACRQRSVAIPSGIQRRLAHRVSTGKDAATSVGHQPGPNGDRSLTTSASLVAKVLP